MSSANWQPRDDVDVVAAAVAAVGGVERRLLLRQRLPLPPRVVPTNPNEVRVQRHVAVAGPVGTVDTVDVGASNGRAVAVSLVATVRDWTSGD